VQSNLLQRKCGCGQSASLTGQCSECQRKKLAPERGLTDSANESESPPVVHEVLRSSFPKIQPKLKIGTPNDRYEQEADRIANQIMRMPKPSMQRQIGTEEDEEETLQAKPIANQITPLIQRQVEPNGEEEEEIVQAKQASSVAPTVTPVVQAGIQNLWQSGGQLLPSTTRTFMESRFGHNFGQVHIHTGDQAARLAQSLNARAFTIGNNIAFGTSEFSPQSTTGRLLLAHELVHTIQQSNHTLRLQRACEDLDAEFRKQQQKSPQMDGGISNPCGSHNTHNCCDNLMGCDRGSAIESAIQGASNRLESTIVNLKKMVIGRRLRRLFRQLFGRRSFKAEVVENLQKALNWLRDTVVPQRKDNPATKSEPSNGREKEQLRAAGPDDSEIPPDIEEVPLEDVPRPAPTKPSQPPVVPGLPSRSPGVLGKQSELSKPPTPCPAGDKSILCALPCGSNCDPGDLAFTDGGTIWFCPLAFTDPITLEATTIHEVVHNLFSGERDIYAYTRLFRVLAQVRDPEGVVGSIAQQNPDSYTALVMAASGRPFEELITAMGGKPPLRFEGFRFRPRQKVEPEVALGFAEAGILEGASQVSSLTEKLTEAPDWSKLSDDLKQTAERLRQHGLLRPTTSSNDGAAELSYLKTIKAQLDVIKKAVNSVGSIQREDSFKPASYLGGTLTVSERFFLLSTQRSQTREVIGAFVESSSVSSAQVPAYIQFLEDSIGDAKGLSDLPFPGPEARQPLEQNTGGEG